MYEELIEQLSERDYYKSLGVIQQLAKRGSQITRPLIDILYQPVDFSVHSNAIHTLSLIGDSDAVLTLLDFLQHDHFAYRQQAAIALGSWLQQNTSGEMKSKIVEALLKRLYDNCEDVRESVVSAIKGELNSQVIEKLVEVYVEEYEKQGFFIQEQIVEALIDYADVLDILSSQLQTSLPMERIAIIDILSQFETVQATSIMQMHYKEEKNTIVREIINSRIQN